MIVIVCLDDREGMSFCGRRLSTDRALRRDLLDLSGMPWMNSYSARQFETPVRQDEAFLSRAARGECCFVENTDILPWLEKIEKLIVYRWNRHYPSDRKFPWAHFRDWRCTQTAQFPGSSHETITREVYEP